MRGNCAVSTCTIAFLFICIVCICSKSGNAMLCQYAFLVKNTLQGGSLPPYRCKYTFFSWTNGISSHFFFLYSKKEVKKVVMLPPSCQYYHNIRLCLPPSAMPQQQYHLMESKTCPDDTAQFSYLAIICLVIWRLFIWSFGILSFGHLNFKASLLQHSRYYIICFRSAN